MGHQGRWDIRAGDQGPGERQVRAGKAGIWVRGQSRALIIKWADDLICQDHAALPPAAPVFAHGACERGGRGGRDGSHGWAPQHGLPLAKTWIWLPLSVRLAGSRGQN